MQTDDGVAEVIVDSETLEEQVYSDYAEDYDYCDIRASHEACRGIQKHCNADRHKEGPCKLGVIHELLDDVVCALKVRHLLDDDALDALYLHGCLNDGHNELVLGAVRDDDTFVDLILRDYALKFVGNSPVAVYLACLAAADDGDEDVFSPCRKLVIGLYSLENCIYV